MPTNEYESKEGDVKINDLWQLLNIILAISVLYFLNVFDFFDKVGYFIGIPIVIIGIIILNYLLSKFFALFVE